MPEKPYPSGYEAPSLAGHYTGIPILAMEPFVPQTKIPQQAPETLVIRASVEIRRSLVWPQVEGFEGPWSLAQDGLYTAEGCGIKDQARISEITLRYTGVCTGVCTGFCTTPTPSFVPFQDISALLPYHPGDVLWRHTFYSPPALIPLGPNEDGVLRLFPLGGYGKNVLNPLETTPLYFFLESGAGGAPASPNVRFLFYDDILRLRANPRGPTLVFPEGMGFDPVGSVEAALTRGAWTLRFQDFFKTSYQSVQVQSLPGDGHLVDVVLMAQ